MLTDAQIESLYTFCKKKGVRYYDVQSELVDHLANAIEAKMQLNTTVGFEEALQHVYRGFGIYGFSKIVSEKEAAVYQKQRLLFYGNLRQLFGWPKLFLFLLFAVAHICLIQFTGYEVAEVVFLATIAALVLFDIFFMIQQKRLIKGQLILLSRIHYQSGWVTLPAMLYFIFDVNASFIDQLIPSQHLPLLSSVIAAAYCVILVAHIQMHLRINKEVRRLYPQFWPASGY